MSVRALALALALARARAPERPGPVQELAPALAPARVRRWASAPAVPAAHLASLVSQAPLPQGQATVAAAIRRLAPSRCCSQALGSPPLPAAL